MSIKSAATGKTYQLLELAPNEATLAAIVHNAQVKRSAQKKTKAAENQSRVKTASANNFFNTPFYAQNAAAGLRGVLQFRDALAEAAAVLMIGHDPKGSTEGKSTGKIGTNLMPCCDWLATIEGGDATPGDLVVPNPFTGAEGKTADGKKSYIAQSCLARLPFVVIEFDSMPLKVQAAFWRGLLIRSPLAPKVAAITYSGSKSLHGLIHVGCDALSDWQIVCRQLRGLFAANPDPAFRADEQAMRPRTGTRLPGVRRLNNGKHQSLLYLNQEAVSSRMENSKAPVTPSAPRKTPQARSSHGAGKEPTSADERATGEFSALPCDCAPLPPAMPPDDASLDELIAAFEVAEAWQSRFLPGPFK